MKVGQNKKEKDQESGKILGGLHGRKDIDLCKRGQDMNEVGMQKDQNDLLVAAVEAAT